MPRKPAIPVHYAEIAQEIQDNLAVPFRPGEGIEDPNSIQAKTVTRFVEKIVKQRFPQALDLSVRYLTGTPGTHAGMDPEMQIWFHVPLETAKESGVALEALTKEMEPLKNSYDGTKGGWDPEGFVKEQPMFDFDRKIDDVARVFVGMNLSLDALYRNLLESQKGQGTAKSA